MEIRPCCDCGSDSGNSGWRSARDCDVIVVLFQVIVGGAQEELSLQQLMEDVNLEVVNECAEAGEEDVDTEELTRKVHMKLKSKGRNLT